jgi:Cu(I)/Ag(I) efflux system membrane fusion protein
LALLAPVALASGCGSEPEPAPGDASRATEQGSAAGLDGALEYYLRAQEALADDSFEPARQAVAALQAHMDPEHAGLAGAAAAAADIEALRAAFLPLSNALIDRELPEGFRVAHCPMAFDWEGAHWIQKDGEIANPYYGSGMLHCGVFVERDAGSGDSGS